MPEPLGPYRQSPARHRARRRVGRSRWIAAGGASVALLGLGAWLAPGLTAAIVGGLLLYVVAPWFVTSAPGA